MQDNRIYNNHELVRRDGVPPGAICGSCTARWQSMIPSLLFNPRSGQG